MSAGGGGGGGGSCCWLPVDNIPQPVKDMLRAKVRKIRAFDIRNFDESSSSGVVCGKNCRTTELQIPRGIRLLESGKNDDPQGI